MNSYISLYHFLPKTKYQPLNDLIPTIKQTIKDQNVASKIKDIDIFIEQILSCMEVYYRLVGIDAAVIAGKKNPNGVLVRYTQSLIAYFQELQKQTPSNKEIVTLEYSGVDSIKTRYKYTHSVIKKIVKLGLRNRVILEEPLKIFLKGGALHDLIGMLFVCSYPYEKEWIARTLYNFFEYNHRTDDHLLYGFYTVEKKSGYRALHCDHTIFNPRFDIEVSGDDKESISTNPLAIFELLEADDNTATVLRKLKDYFNIEIQLHTSFETLWASMEHTNNYNIQAKGKGRNSKITVQWKLLSDNMKKLEEQFEQLQIDTQQARFEVLHHGGYLPVKKLFDILGCNDYPTYANSTKRVEELEDLLRSHEISRQEYVYQLQKESDAIKAFASKEKNPTVKMIFKMQRAFIYYGLANQREYFNSNDINQFIQKTLKLYKKIILFLSSNKDIYKGDLLNIVSTIRYLYIGQKYGLGVMNPSRDIFEDEETPAVSYKDSLAFFKEGISLFTKLKREDMIYLKDDNTISLKIIHHYDILTREWELFNHKDDSLESAKISQDIATFREQFITKALYRQFNALLSSDKIKNIGFVVNFYTTLVWHGLQRPMDALKEIIKYSAYDKIKSSDLFYYELASYRFLYIKGCTAADECHTSKELHIHTNKREHFGNYHRQNMIQLLFRIKRNESYYKFQKAKLYFEQISQTRFEMDHFSGSIESINISC